MDLLTDKEKGLVALLLIMNAMIGLTVGIVLEFGRFGLAMALTLLVAPFLAIKFEINNRFNEIPTMQ